MNVFVKAFIDDATMDKIRSTLAEMFPDTDPDAVLTDGKVIPINVSEHMDRWGVPVEILLPVLHIIGGMINSREESEKEMYYIKKINSVDNTEKYFHGLLWMPTAQGACQFDYQTMRGIIHTMRGMYPLLEFVGELTTVAS